MTVQNRKAGGKGNPPGVGANPASPEILPGLETSIEMVQESDWPESRWHCHMAALEPEMFDVKAAEASWKAEYKGEGYL
ncbi:MAG: hypothetical protein ACLTW9_18540 [Enterocloster sp.]